jgi:hypothetical protein
MMLFLVSRLFANHYTAFTIQNVQHTVVDKWRDVDDFGRFLQPLQQTTGTVNKCVDEFFQNVGLECRHQVFPVRTPFQS